MARKTFVILFALLALCGCSKNDFKVWKDLNTAKIESIKADSADYYRTLQSGTLYRVVDSVYHTGYTPKLESYVCVTYTGWLIDGTKFESGEKEWLLVGKLVKGWQEALCVMTDGERGRIYVPYGLGYGSDGKAGSNGNFVIPPYSTLIFDLELVEVINK